MEKELENKNIDIKVFNALNLINPTLGKAYEDDSFNPFDADFELKDEFVTKVLQNSKITSDVPMLDFLEFGSKTVKQHFTLSLQNNNSVLEGVENVSAVNDSRDFSDIKLFLKNRILLLTQAIKLLSDVNADSLKLYEEIYRLNCGFSNIMEGSYFEGFDVQAAVNAFLRLAPPVRSSAAKKSFTIDKTPVKTKTSEVKKVPANVAERKIPKTKNVEREM